MVGFGGWLMPVQYSGIVDEHMAVRKGLGVFDISHMGEFFVGGEGAAAWLDRMLTNNVASLGVGKCQYTLMLNPQGGVIDDLIIYRIGDREFFLVVNASKIDEDFAWLSSHISPDVKLENESDTVAALAVQGPRSEELFTAFFGGKHSVPGRNEILYVEIDELPYYIARTGYTGEDGFEVFCPASRAVKSWTDVLRKGAEFGIKPCGLGSRDSLRLEMGYPLNGSDLSPERTVLESALSAFVDLNKGDFIGRDALVAQKQNGLPSRLIAFQMTGQAPPPRPHYPIFHQGSKVGEVTSGGSSPCLKNGIGMGYLPAALAKVGTEIAIEIRGQKYAAAITRRPIYRPAKS